MVTPEYNKKVEAIINKYNVDNVGDFFADIGDLLNLVLRDTKPHLIEIDDCIRDNMEAMNGSGVITITLKAFDGKITEIVLNRMTKVKLG